MNRLRVFVFLTVFAVLLSGCALFRPAVDPGSDTTDGTVMTDPPVTTDPATTEPLETAEPPVTEKRVSVLAVGDNIIHEAVFTDAKNRAADGAEYDFVPMYAGVAGKIAAADLAFVNHESPLAGKEYKIEGYPHFNSPHEAGEALAAIGFDIVNLGNNHIMDRSVAGARATIDFVRTLPVTYIGAYLDQADLENIRVTEMNGIRIAWVSFTYFSNHAYNPGTDNIIIPLMNDENAIRSRIKAAKELSDFVIVSAHWDQEKAAISSEQKRLSAVMAEAGADVILGHHSHILQDVQWRENTDGSRTLIAYSLGNFISTQYYAYNMVGGMLTFDVVMEDGKCRVETPVLHPTVTQYSKNRDSLQVYLLEDYSESLAKVHGTLVHSPDFSLSWIYNHVKNIVTEEFLPPYFE